MADAVDTTDIAISTAEIIRLSPSWAPSVISVQENSGYRRIVKQRRPETRRNPPAPKGGLRQPADWYHDWMNYAELPRPLETRPKPGVQAWHVVSGSKTTVFGRWIRSPAWLLDKIEPPPHVLFASREWAKTEVLKKASQTKWDLSVSAVELRETTDMIRELTRSAMNAYRSYRNAAGLEGFKGNILSTIDRYERRANRRTRNDRGNPDPGNTWYTELMRDASAQGIKGVSKKGLERFRDKWMEYQFGIRPLAGDISDAMDHLSNDGWAPPAMILRAGKEVAYKRRLDVGIYPSFQARVMVRGSVQTHFSLVVQMTDEANSMVTQLGLNRPLVTLYEAARLSWLLEYVVGVGSWLEAGYARSLVDFKSGTVSTLWKGAADPAEIVILDWAQEWVKKFDPRYVLEGGRFTREVLTSLPVPAAIPEIKSTLGVKQALNSLFALSNLLSGKPRGF